MSKTSRPQNTNTGDGPRFTVLDIGLKNQAAIISPDCAFWCLAPKSKAVDVLSGDGLTEVFTEKQAVFEREMERVRFQRTPSAVYFNPTDRCNLNCRYCYLPEEMRQQGEQMGKDGIVKALSLLKDYFAAALPSGFKPQLVFHGSEPLLAREEVFLAIERFSGDFRFGLQTNATLLDTEAINFLSGHQVVIGVSLDGHRADVADAARQSWSGRPNFKRVIKALKELAGYPALNVICTITKENVNHLPGVVRFLHGLGIETAMLNPVRCTREGGRALKPDNDVLTRQFIKALDITLKLFEKTGRKLVIANFANVLTGILAPTARRLMCDISPCGGGRCFFAVSAAGDVFPCSEFIGLPMFKGGNLFAGNLKEVLGSEPFNLVAGRRVEDFRPCDTCAVRHFCGAPCPAEVYSRHGCFTFPSDYCEFYEEQIRYAFRLIASGREKAFLWEDWEETTREIFALSFA